MSKLRLPWALPVWLRPRPSVTSLLAALPTLLRFDRRQVL
jgi:hypothetical protein